MFQQHTMKLDDLESRHANSSERGLTLDQFVRKYFPQYLHLLGGSTERPDGAKPARQRRRAVPDSETGRQRCPGSKGSVEAVRRQTVNPLSERSVSSESSDSPIKITPQQKWRKKNKKKLADYQKEYRSKNK